MILHRLALCLVLLTASIGFAQVPEDAPLAGPEDSPPASELAPSEPAPSEPAPSEPVPSEPAPSEPTAPPGELIPYNYRPQHEAPPDLILPRLLAETFGGVLGGVGVGLMGLLLGVSVIEDTDCTSAGEVCAAVLVLVTVPAVFLGIPLGVQTAGERLGGRGQYLHSLAGTLLGTGLGIIYGLSGDGAGPMILGLTVGPLLGSIVGYEISHALSRYGAPSPLAGSSARGGPQVVPVVGATPGGGLLGGLSGRF